jgi:hypothetical protein
MEEKKSKQCFTAVLKKFNSLDNQISRIKDQLDELRKLMIDGQPIGETKEDICLATEVTLLTPTKEDT